MSKHKWYLPLAAAAVTALSLTGVSLADNQRSHAPSAKSQASAGHHKAKRAKRGAGLARASAWGGVQVMSKPIEFVVPAGQTVDQAVTCDYPTVAVGGGFNGTKNNEWPNLELLSSYPTASNGWTVRVRNKGNSPAQVAIALVTCAS